MRVSAVTCSLHPAEPADGVMASEVRSALVGRGVQVVSSSAEGAAICVSASPDVSFPARVAELGAHGGRVLAVVGPGAMPTQLVWALLGHGASDVLEWQAGDGHADEAICARLQRWDQIDRTVAAPVVRDQLVGRSRGWLDALRRTVEIACYATSALLLVGESGTGKELVARLFHHLDSRENKGNLIVVDCTTIVPTLSGSELFGHERGAFTGAHSTREGALSAADGGSLFLDEIGELPLPQQAELLRAVQEGTYKRVGSDSWRRTRFRLVCATNRDLEAEVDAGRFRLDLYHRLATNVVRLPPLRERTGDVLPLFAHFLAEATGGPLEVHPAVVDLLERRDYPGNIRDLRQLARRIAVRHVGPGCVTPGDVPDDERPPVTVPSTAPSSHPATAALLHRAVAAALDDGLSYRDIRSAAVDAAVQQAVELAGGDLLAAAGRLGVTRRMLEQRRAGRRADLSPG